MTALRIETGWPPRALSPNARPHWRRKWKAGTTAKQEAYWATYQAAPKGFAAAADAFAVTIRAEPKVGRVRDRDNLVASCKPFLDGIAQALGVNDSAFEAPSVQWGERHKTGRLIFEIEPRQ